MLILFFIQLINKRRLLMKTNTQMMLPNKKIKREFIQRFKTEVKDSNSVHNLRISKIDSSCYKIYNTHTKNTTQNHATTKHSKQHALYFSNNPHSQMNYMQSEKKARFGTNTDHFHKQCGKSQIQKDQECTAKSQHLEQVLTRRLQDFYQLIRSRVQEVQNLCVLTEQKKIEVNKLQNFINFISIIDGIYKNTAKLKSICGFHLQAHNINLILKSLVQKVDSQHHTSGLNIKSFPQHLDRIKTDADGGNVGYGHEILSVSSFKIQNEKIHQQQFLNAYLSSHNSKVDIQYNLKAESCIKEQQQIDEHNPLSSYQNTTKKYTTQNMRVSQQKTNRLSTTNFKSMAKLSSKQNQNQVVCELLRCNWIHRQQEMEDSDSKRRVLNEVIVMLNTKYNRSFKFQ